ncbi:probable Orotidine 5'-phosphate decarboxylase [Phialocephala subalpina]|uniref:Orotidine 5'-phosphate decarboxylase n=1 Tax=Phialocephala subalpina TaxID=576137 RepID=A0A1L7XHE2_9HELO|nr:probable Orotidine 5'-phosphate decarboxylase [Phialocephala subalpina]
MSSKSTLPYATRAKNHLHPVARRLFDVAEAKKSNVIISADMGTTEELLKLADQLGPYIAVFKTHIDLLSDLSDSTISGLKDLAAKHNFMIFEDRKFIDIGHTVQQQYHDGALRISEFAHVVNASVLAGDGIIEALEQTMAAPNFLYKDERAMLILSEMTTAGSLATGDYTRFCIEIAKKHKKSVIGFVATQALTHFRGSEGGEDEDFVIFTTGVNATTKVDSLGQQYQTPSSAISRGSDFIIVGRGIYAAPNPVAAVKHYQKESWDAYLARTNQN